MKPIPSYEGLYSADDQGNIYSHRGTTINYQLISVDINLCVYQLMILENGHQFIGSSDSHL